MIYRQCIFLGFDAYFNSLLPVMNSEDCASPNKNSEKVGKLWMNKKDITI